MLPAGFLNENSKCTSCVSLQNALLDFALVRIQLYHIFSYLYLLYCSEFCVEWDKMAEPAQDNNTIVATNGTVTTSPVTQSITTATHTTGASSANVIMVTSAPSNTQPSAVGVTIAPNTVATPTPLQIQASPIQIQSSTQQAVGTPITSTGAHRTQQMAPMQVIPNQTYIQQQYIQQQLMLQGKQQT